MGPPVFHQTNFSFLYTNVTLEVNENLAERWKGQLQSLFQYFSFILSFLKNFRYDLYWMYMVHPSLKVAWSVPVQHVLYKHSVVPSSPATQCKVDPARFLHTCSLARSQWVSYTFKLVFLIVKKCNLLFHRLSLRQNLSSTLI